MNRRYSSEQTLLFHTESNKACNILMIKILTPTVSPHFSNAFVRNQKMPCTFVRRFSLNFSLGGREMMTINLFKRECFKRHVLIYECTEAESSNEFYATLFNGRHVVRREFQEVLKPISKNIEAFCLPLRSSCLRMLLFSLKFSRTSFQSSR